MPSQFSHWKSSCDRPSICFIWL